MLIFQAPLWLWALPPIAAAALLGLLRGQRRPRPVSTTRFWRAAAGEPAPTPTRRIDPLWLLLSLAALLGALALAEPAWSRPLSPPPPPTTPPLPIQWNVRSLRSPAAPDPATEAWLHVAAADPLPGHLLLRVESPGSPAREIPLDAEQLHRGLTAPVEGQPVTLVINASDRELARQTFTPPASAGASFGLLEAGDIDPALRRVFEIHPGAHPGNPTLQPQIVLLGPGADASAFTTAPETAAATRSSPPSPALVVLPPGVSPPGSPTSPPPPGNWLDAPPDRPWTPIPTDSPLWPRDVRLNDVQVSRLLNAPLDPSWTPLATANGHPWIAARSSGHQHLQLWLSASPSRDSDWPNHPSFVLFFAEMIDRALAAAPPPPIIQWTPQPQPSPPPPAPPDTPLRLRDTTEIIAIAMLLLAIAGLITRHFRTIA